MKRIFAIIMMALTLFFMAMPVAAVDGDDANIEYWEDVLAEDLLEVEKGLEPFDLVCYDPIVNHLNEEDEYIEEPGMECENNHISTYIIGKTDENTDKTLDLEELKALELNAQADGEYFKNLISVENNTNVSYLSSLLNQKYPGYKKLRVYSQGACSDGEYIYNALLVKYKFNGVWNEETCIVSGLYNDDNFITTSIRFSSDMVGEHCLTSKGDLKHTNGMTYNNLKDTLVIACAENGYNNEIYVMDASYFRGETSELPIAKKHMLSCMINSISYNEKRNKYVAMLKGTDMYFVYFDSDFNLIGAFNSINSMTEIEEGEQISLSHQDICCDDNYIYATYFKK